MNMNLIEKEVNGENSKKKNTESILKDEVIFHERMRGSFELRVDTLFLFDSQHILEGDSNGNTSICTQLNTECIAMSDDLTSAKLVYEKNGSKVMLFGNRSFKRGVHYYEVEIKGVSWGSMCIGVSESRRSRLPCTTHHYPLPPTTLQQPKQQREQRKKQRRHRQRQRQRRGATPPPPPMSGSTSEYGDYGFISWKCLVDQHHGQQMYGEFFHDGNESVKRTIGVLLDMDRGIIAYTNNGKSSKPDSWGKHITDNMGIAHRFVKSGGRRRSYYKREDYHERENEREYYYNREDEEDEDHERGERGRGLCAGRKRQELWPTFVMSKKAHTDQYGIQRKGDEITLKCMKFISTDSQEEREHLDDILHGALLLSHWQQMKQQHSTKFFHPYRSITKTITKSSSTSSSTFLLFREWWCGLKLSVRTRSGKEIMVSPHCLRFNHWSTHELLLLQANEKKRDKKTEIKTKNMSSSSSEEFKEEIFMEEFKDDICDDDQEEKEMREVRQWLLKNVLSEGSESIVTTVKQNDLYKVTGRGVARILGECQRGHLWYQFCEDDSRERGLQDHEGHAWYWSRTEFLHLLSTKHLKQHRAKKKKKRKRKRKKHNNDIQEQEDEDDEEEEVEEEEEEVIELASSLSMCGLSDVGFTTQDCLHLVLMTGRDWDKAMNYVSEIGDPVRAQQSVRNWYEKRQKEKETSRRNKQQSKSSFSSDDDDDINDEEEEEEEEEEEDDDDESRSEYEELSMNLSMMLSDYGFTNEDCMALCLKTGGSWDDAMNEVSGVGDPNIALTNIRQWYNERQESKQARKKQKQEKKQEKKRQRQLKTKNIGEEERVGKEEREKTEGREERGWIERTKNWLSLYTDFDVIYNDFLRKKNSVKTNQSASTKNKNASKNEAQYYETQYERDCLLVYMINGMCVLYQKRPEQLTKENFQTYLYPVTEDEDEDKNENENENDDNDNDERRTEFSYLSDPRIMAFKKRIEEENSFQDSQEKVEESKQEASKQAETKSKNETKEEESLEQHERRITTIPLHYLIRFSTLLLLNQKVFLLLPLIDLTLLRNTTIDVIHHTAASLASSAAKTSPKNSRHHQRKYLDSLHSSYRNKKVGGYVYASGYGALVSSLRRILFYDTKHRYWQNVLFTTTTITGKNHCLFFVVLLFFFCRCCFSFVDIFPFTKLCCFIMFLHGAFYIVLRSIVLLS